VEDIVIALTVIIKITLKTLSSTKSTTNLSEKASSRRFPENIRDAHAGSRAVQKDIANVTRLGYFVEITVSVFNVKITNL